MMEKKLNEIMLFIKDITKEADKLYYKNEQLQKENEQLNEDVQRRKENEKILIKTANDLNELIDKLEKENEQLKQVIEEFAENPTQHNLWKLRTVLKSDVE